MRGTPPSISVEVGDAPRIVGSGTTNTSVALGNAHLIFFGSVDQRRVFVMELAREVGLSVLVHETDDQVLEAHLS
jgi:hypothetical protein